MKLWIGKEKEGKYKGMETLFIGSSDITFGEIERTLKDNPNVSQLYFGAGGCTPINNNVIYDCYKQIKDKIITAEISIDNFIESDIKWLRKINVIITFINDKVNLFNKLKSVQIKLQGKVPNTIYIEELSDFIHTDCKDLEGKKYKDDKVIK